MAKNKYIIIREFTLYILVGGVSFLIDFSILYFFKEHVNLLSDEFHLYIATAAGFLSGLICNYTLSLLLVFVNKEQRIRGKTIKGFAMFTIIGIVGLLLTELGMFVGVYLLNSYYLFVKIIITSFVLFWNFAARKILIFK